MLSFAAPMLSKVTVTTFPQIMNYFVQLLLVGTNFTLHLFFPFFCGILRLKWVSLELCLSSMMPCCVTTLCYSEEGCAGGLLVSALLMSMSLWIYLRISETDKSLSLAKNVMTPLLGPWTLKGDCITGDRWSGSQLWVAVLYGCDTHTSVYGLFLAAQECFRDASFPPLVKHCNHFWNQGGSTRQRECASRGEWWAVGRGSPASEHRDGSVCQWEGPGDLLVPRHHCQGLFYKLSLKAEPVHNSLVEDWGMPVTAWDWVVCTYPTTRLWHFFLAKVFCSKKC